MNKKIKKLEKEKADLWKRINEINAEIKELDIEEYNYIGKYIYCPEHGYLYVTAQHFDEKSVWGDDIMWLQGFGIYANLTDYADEFFVTADAQMEWNIHLNTFKGYIVNGELKEITADEFVKAYYDYIDELKKESPAMLGCLEKYVEKNK